MRPLPAIAALIAVCALRSLPADEAAPTTLRGLIAEMIDPDALARWPEPAFVSRQASSYDRRRTAPGDASWFANDDHSQFVRVAQVDGRTERVMMDVDGPGAIVRFWLTGHDVRKGRLRIYLDGATTPTIEFKAYDLLANDLAVDSPWIQAHPEHSGSTMYLPIPYARHCTVSWWEDPGPTAMGPRYYQIGYRTYSAGTRVESFTRAGLEAVRGDLAHAGHLLLDPPAAATGTPAELRQTIAPGAEAGLDLPAGPAAVRRLELRLEAGDGADLERALRTSVVRMRCDDEDTVWCPAGDFSGSGVGLNTLASWYRQVSADGPMTCRWTMPYRERARVAIANLGARPVTAVLRATTGPWRWDARSLHFRSCWHQQADIVAPPFIDWNLVGISGRGIYVGDTLAVFNPVATWYGEGDEKIRVDGEAFPSHLGTGTEDYYNYSYAPRGVFQTPFANQPRAGQPLTQGHNTCTRTRHLDGIPFTRSLVFDFEVMPWKSTALTYAATTYWYASPGAVANVAPAPGEALRPIPHLPSPVGFPGANECERLRLASSTPGLAVERQSMSPWPGGRWSAQEQLLVRSARPGDTLELELPAAGAAPARLVLHATRAPDYGILRFRVDGVAAGADFDGFAPQVEPSGPIDLGSFTPRDGRFLVRVEVVGADPRSRGMLAGLDCVVMAAAP
jgi:hypothetical protein